MLAVGIDLYDVREPSHVGVAQAGDNCATFAQVDWQSDNLHSVRGCMEARYRRQCRLVAGVIDDDHVEPCAAQAHYDRTECDEVVMARDNSTRVKFHAVPNCLRDCNHPLSRVDTNGHCRAWQLSLRQVPCQGLTA